jgi:hypothetical protein
MTAKINRPKDGESLVENFTANSKSRVEIWTDQHRIVGDLHVPTFGEGAKWRVSDVLNQQERAFVALSDVTLSTSKGRKLWYGDFLAVNKRSIILLKALQE